MELRPTTIFLCATFFLSGYAFTEEIPQKKLTSELNFRLAPDVLEDAEIQLINGKKVSSAEWDTLLIATFESANKYSLTSTRKTCTATLVGPNVALLAGHCLEPPYDSILSPPSLTVGTRRIPFRCEVHPEYLSHDLLTISTPRGSEDYALCILDDKGNSPDVLRKMRFETLDVSEVLKKGEQVLMTGYGCSDPTIVGGSFSAESTNELRIGLAHIDQPAGSIPGEPSYVSITASGTTSPALCPGDSGGPLFSGDDMKDHRKKRRVRGVNSKIEIHDDHYVSSIAALGTMTFRNWVHDWLERNKKFSPKVCGVNLKAGEQQCKE